MYSCMYVCMYVIMYVYYVYTFQCVCVCVCVRECVCGKKDIPNTFNLYIMDTSLVTMFVFPGQPY